MTDLRIERMTLGYGKATVIENLDLTVRSGELVTILGANGAGKTTLLNGIMGLLPPRSGRVLVNDEIVTGFSPAVLVDRGMLLVPERRELFATLNVEINLRLGAYLRPQKMAEAMERVYSIFPVLHERRKQIVKTLSGGEQQMLAIGRALMADPKILMLDEPSIGLAPKIVREILDVIGKLKSQGLTILLVEQNARLALDVADRGYVIELGKIVLEGTSAALASNVRLQQAYLGGAADYSAARQEKFGD